MERNLQDKGSPTSELRDFRSIISIIPGIIALMTVVLISCSAIYNWTFFLYFDPKFMSLLTISDYLAGSIWWLPIAILSVPAYISLPYFMKKAAFRTKLAKKSNSKPHIYIRIYNFISKHFLFYLVIITFLFVLLFIPLKFGIPFILISIISSKILVLLLIGLPKKPELRQFIILFPAVSCSFIMLFLASVVGIVHAFGVIFQIESPQKIVTKNGLIENVIVMRNVEKGIIVNLRSNNSVIFLSSNHLVSIIKEDKEPIDSSIFCWITGKTCPGVGYKYHKNPWTSAAPQRPPIEAAP